MQVLLWTQKKHNKWEYTLFIQEWLLEWCLKNEVKGQPYWLSTMIVGKDEN